MKRFFKLLTVAILAMLATCACVFTLTACEGKQKSSDYNFTVVYEDGTPVKGSDAENTKSNYDAETDKTVEFKKVCIQICFGSCKEYTIQTGGNSLDENGKIGLSQKTINDLFNSETDVTKFTFHVWNVKGLGGGDNHYVIEVDGKGDYELKLDAAHLENL